MDTIGADIVLKTLAEEGVDVIFGYPGANTLPLNDRLTDSPIRHYLMRHEQAAAHAADGYARARRRSPGWAAPTGPTWWRRWSIRTITSTRSSRRAHPMWR